MCCLSIIIKVTVTHGFDSRNPSDVLTPGTVGAYDPGATSGGWIGNQLIHQADYIVGIGQPSIVCSHICVMLFCVIAMYDPIPTTRTSYVFFRIRA